MDMKDKNMIECFNCAINGIIETIKKERNMKIHIVACFLLIFLSLFLNIDRMELLILILTVSSVFVAELLNTGIEKAVDLVTNKDHPLAKFSKDAAAGAVLVSSIASLFVGYIIFFDKIIILLTKGYNFVRTETRLANIFVLTMCLLLIIVVGLKAITKKGTALEGGMPSGHATISSSLFVMIFYLSDDIRIVLISFVMMLLVCQSRIKAKIHTLSEVVAGVIIGTAITFLIFNLIYR